jgi:hypothetical protein
LAKLVEGILNQILEAQVTESLGAEKHERGNIYFEATREIKK